MADIPDICDEAIHFLRLVTDADSQNRAAALEDLRFGYGDQWPVEIQNSRQLEARPCLTINETNAYIRQICNEQRKQRPRGKAHPVNSGADEQIAKVVNGVMRHWEVKSHADNAFDTAFEFAVRMGWGYFRLRTDYTREDSFDQDLFFDTVHNPFNVYFDPNSTAVDGSDAERCLITELVPKKTFQQLYPGADEAQFSGRGTGDSDSEWVTKEDIRVAEYFKVVKEKHDLLHLSDGTIVWADEKPPEYMMRHAGIYISGERKSYKRVVKWQKITNTTVLEERNWVGRWIPVIPVYGAHYVIDGKRIKAGLIRDAKDPQRMKNFWDTSITESIAMAPKAKWVMAEGQDEGHENEWAGANVRALPVLRYKQTDIDGRDAPPPQRQQPEPPPAGAIEAAMGASQNLRSVLGVYDPNQMPGVKSGKAINAEQQQTDTSNFHFYDNLTQSIAFAWRQGLDIIPRILDTERVMRIIGDDGRPSLVTVNEGKDTGAAAEVIKNNMQVGEYDVVMDTGPGYDSKRQEAFATMAQLLTGPLGKEIAEKGADLVVRMIDASGMDVLADRLAAGNPLANLDENSDIPPQAQIIIKQLQQRLQQAEGVMKQLGDEVKNKHGLEQLKQDSENKREFMRTNAMITDKREERMYKQHDTETRALTAQNVEELRGLVQLLLKHIDTRQLEMQADRKDEQLKRKSDQSETLQ